ncbi:MAG TPA: Hsp20/alpha crystallin family protein [Caulobacteraceae bacterium]|jgi:HSP20 family protein|nr:Hsp20/alpha crystallin family protein [Caulobacteraceae bacterium]
MPDVQGQGSQSNPQPNPQSNPEVKTDMSRARDRERRPPEGASFEAQRRARDDEAMPDRSPFMTAPELWRDTWRPLATIQTEMARWFDEVWREAASNRGGYINTSRGLPELTGGTSFAGLPRADLKETDKDYRLHVELPGLKVADVQVELDNDALVVRGMKADESRDDNANFHITERRFGRVERRFALPRDVDHTAVKADFRDGVLNIVMPKDADADQRRRIEVRPG